MEDGSEVMRNAKCSCAAKSTKCTVVQTVLYYTTLCSSDKHFAAGYSLLTGNNIYDSTSIRELLYS